MIVPNTLYYQKNKALGTLVEMVLVSGESLHDVNSVFKKLWLEIFTFEKRFSRFLPDSELTNFNKNAGLKFIVSAEFKNMLTKIVDISKNTRELANPFVLPALYKAGYSKSMLKGFEDDVQVDYSYANVANLEYLELGNNWVRIPRNSAIDLGGYGKGYLADKLASLLTGRVYGFWLSLGGDVIVGGKDTENQYWEISVSGLNGKNIAKIYQDDDGTLSAATSGTNIRHGKTANSKWHHIIDPRTLLPAKTDITCATVVDKSALKADVMAKCAVILGSTGAGEFLSSNKISDYCLQLHNDDTLIIHGDNIKLDS